MDNSKDNHSMLKSENNIHKKVHVFKLNKIVFCLISIIILIIILNIGLIIWYNFNNSLPPKNGYPEENTKNHSLGNCYVYDDCNVNGTEKLIPRIKYKIPNQFKTDKDGTNCPLYWEAAPTYFHMNHKCNDLGFGCCLLPINTECAIRIHFLYETNDITTTKLYINHMKRYKSNEFILDIAKEDAEGSNCPSYERLLFEPLWNTNLIKKYIVFFTIINIILLVIISSCLINIDFYEKRNLVKTIDEI